MPTMFLSFTELGSCYCSKQLHHLSMHSAFLSFFFFFWSYYSQSLCSYLHCCITCTILLCQMINEYWRNVGEANLRNNCCSIYLQRLRKIISNISIQTMWISISNITADPLWLVCVIILVYYRYPSCDCFLIIL